MTFGPCPSHCATGKSGDERSGGEELCQQRARSFLAFCFIDIALIVLQLQQVATGRTKSTDVLSRPSPRRQHRLGIG
jgi:hypothetical protein